MFSPRLTLTGSQTLSFGQETGVCQLPVDLPDDKTLKAGLAADDPESLYIQALLHFKGIRAPLDWNLAYQLMKKSADLEYPLAQFALAHFCQSGVGTRMDYTTAQSYYLRASQNGVPGATNALIAMQNDTVWLERYGRKRRLTAPVEYQRPRREPDVSFGSPRHTKRWVGQYSPLNLPRKLQKRNPLGI
jgi:TPR repeat protein